MSRMHRNRITDTPQMRKQGRFRLMIQLLAAALFNGYAAGFLHGKIYTGNAKRICVPVLNCYSCPGALGACPIGSMQAVAGSGTHRFSFYVLGIITLFGTLLGRLLCGFLCPFGLIQDLLHKIPTPKLRIPRKADRILRYLKYAVLVVLVLLLPAVIVNQYGIGDPWFCKYICPAGTLEGGIPLILKNEQLQELTGFLFSWKLGILIAVILGSVFIGRCFCRYLCPLGAFYALFNRFALYRMQVSEQTCIRCGKCEQICPMAVDVTKQINGTECIRCGKCKAACPTQAITSGFLCQSNQQKGNEHGTKS